MRAFALLAAAAAIAVNLFFPGHPAAVGAGIVAVTALVVLAARRADEPHALDPARYVLRTDVRALCLRQGREYGGPLHPTALALSIVGNLVVDGLELPPEQRADDGVDLGF